MLFRKEKKSHPVLVLTLTVLSVAGAYAIADASKKKLECVCQTVKGWFCHHKMPESCSCECE